MCMIPIEEELFGYKKRRQSINQKEKGNANELRVAHLLTAWTGHEFVRVPMSGGLRWKNRVDVCGDVINTDPNFKFPFSVETKHVAKLGVKGQFLRSNSVVYTYWDQCARDAEATGKIPFLMIRENGMPVDEYYIFLYLSFYEMMKLEAVQHFRSRPEPDKAFALFGYYASEFFKLVSYETLIAIVK